MRRLVITPLATAVLLAAAACGGSGDSTEESSGSGSEGGGSIEKIKVGAIPIVDVAPLHLGIEQGFFEDEGLDVEVVATTGGAAAVPGVVSGEFDFAFGNVTSLIIARNEGLPLKAVAEGNSSTGEDGADFCGLVVPADSDIKSPKDIGDKTVAINNLKNISDTTVRSSIRKDGGDPKAVRFSELPFPEMPAAVANHQVDAALVVEPFLTVAKDQGAKVIASSFVDPAPDLTIAVYFTTEQMIADNGDQVERFTKAIEKSLAYAQEHPDEARDILPSYTEIEPDVAERITLPAWPPEVNEESVQTLADLMYEDGLIKKEYDVSDVLP